MLGQTLLLVWVGGWRILGEIDLARPLTQTVSHDRYDLSEEMWAEDSIGLLTRAGLHFDAHATDGIDPLYFAEVLMSSGLVLNDDVR